jgi:hypothetical protein
MTVSDHPILNFYLMTELLGSLWHSIIGRNNVHNRFAALAFCKQNAAVDKGEDRVICTEADIFACVVFCAALTDDNVTGENDFSAVAFHAEATTR